MSSGPYTASAPPDVATRIDDFPNFDVGKLYFDSKNNRVYRYVKFNAETVDAALAQYSPVYYDSTDLTQVTGVRSESLADNANQVAGVYRGNAIVVGSVPTALEDKWLFICVGGPTSVLMNNDDDAAVGMALIGGASGLFDTVAVNTAPTNRTVGWITAAVTAATNIAEAMITLVPVG